MKDMMQNPMFLYAIAFFIFVALAYIFGRKPALQWLDGEIAQIRNELDAARQLRAEAETALADCKEKQARAEAEALLIVSMAKEEAATMQKQAAEDLATALARHEALATERIKMAEADAIADVRTAAINAALASARKTLAENMSDVDANKLIDQAIADIPSFKAAKPKAA
jgi:F-type H+-transporting ATPase subunit b